MIFHAGLVPGSSSWEAALDVYDWCEASAADADLVPVGFNPGDLEVRLERMNYSQVRYALMLLHGHHNEKLVRMVPTIGMPPDPGQVFQQETSDLLSERLVDLDYGQALREALGSSKTILFNEKIVEEAARRDPGRAWATVLRTIERRVSKHGWGAAEDVWFGGCVHRIAMGMAHRDVAFARERTIELARMGKPWSDDLVDDALSGLLASPDDAGELAALGDWFLKHRARFKGVVFRNQIRANFPFPPSDEFEVGLIYRLAEVDSAVARAWCGSNKEDLPDDWPFYLVAGWRQHYPAEVMKQLMVLAPKRQGRSVPVNMKEFQAWMLYHEQWRGTREAESLAWAVDAVRRSGLEDRIKWLDQIE
jgi:hypothetical protein